MEHGQRNKNMKKIIVFLVICFLFPITAKGAVWCGWDGTQGQYCQSDISGYIRIPSNYPDRTLANNKIFGTEEVYNAVGFYELTTIHPALGVNQTQDQEVWDKAGNQISRTWTVRDMTQEEIDQRDSRPMPLSEYYLWKALIVKGVITQQEAVNALPQELIDAYLARDRLINP